MISLPGLVQRPVGVLPAVTDLVTIQVISTVPCRSSPVYRAGMRTLSKGPSSARSAPGSSPFHGCFAATGISKLEQFIPSRSQAA